MDLQALLSKNSNDFTNDEKMFIVKEYIKKMKGRDVEVNIYKNIDMTQTNHPLMQYLMSNELNKLQQAFSIALDNLKK